MSRFNFARRCAALAAPASLSIACLSFAGLSFAEDRPAKERTVPSGIGTDTEAPHFRVYTGLGKPATLDDIVVALGKSDVALIGEAHDDPVAHQIQLYLLVRADQQEKAAPGSKRNVILSLEQFETDVQNVVSEYVSGTVRHADFMMDARPWGNYEQDYSPLVEYAKFVNMRVLAANAPRRYVSAAGDRGMQALQGELHRTCQAFLPPLPLPEVSVDYKAHFKWAHMELPTAPVATTDGTSGGGCPYIGLKANTESLLDPIILWDATMAHSISRQLDGATLVVQICGSFHSEFGLGISEFLRHYSKSGKSDSAVTTVITIYPETDIAQFDAARHTNSGDFVILTDASVPRSHEVSHPL
ncbi:hypothetical protein T492DRAFT_1008101 [Pavlovales sp. CCMP2436]|nr:hypothetical protein T492DRAFT_1008101 [Pavlovales sp. CCMP2436]|mmetsp:Transcript_29049/g.71520  ORF Transcript_29049/g.71520 Transcript_29049/m.71520 type:complete len:358 (+) Transcript_29049:42-1115(+)